MGSLARSAGRCFLRADNLFASLVLGRAFARTVRRVVTQEELFSGNRESLRMAFFSRESILWWVITTFHQRRKQYRQLFDSRPFPHLAYIEFRKPSEAQIFLARLGTTAEITGPQGRPRTMSNETLTLIEPTSLLKDDFYALTDEFLAEGDQRYRKRLRILKPSSNNALTKRSAAICCPGGFHRAHFGLSEAGRGFSVVPGYAILSTRFSKRKADTSAMTFVRRSGGKDMEPCFSA